VLDDKKAVPTTDKTVPSERQGLIRIWAKKHRETLERNGWDFSMYTDPGRFLENALTAALGIYLNCGPQYVSHSRDGFITFLLRIKHREETNRTPERERLFPSIIWPDRYINHVE
jgi:hypothetical protein